MQKYNEKHRSTFFSPSRINMNKQTKTIPSDKIMNVNDFVNQKNKFKVKNIFDEKETKNFLLSKEKALMEIQLTDNDSDDSDVDKISNNLNNNTLKEEISKNKKIQNQKNYSKQVSPRKKKGKLEKNKDIKKVKTQKCRKSKNNFSKIEQNDSYDEHLYKFIIDNADESEEIFMKKLNKEIKILENNKNKKNDKINKKKYKSVTNDKLSLPKKNKYNPFNFSETAKNLMKSDNIQISNIKDNTIIQDKIPINTPINTNPICYTSIKNESNKKNIFSEKETIVKNNINNNIESNDKISLMSILSDLM